MFRIYYDFNNEISVCLQSSMVTTCDQLIVKYYEIHQRGLLQITKLRNTALIDYKIRSSRLANRG